MLTYTFIMQFRDGVYSSQVSGNDLRQSIISWVQNLSLSEIKHFSKKSQSELIDILAYEVPIPIEGLLNVWCLSLSLKTGFLMLNIIKTDITAA
jgi:hypothetical protein